MAYWFLVAAIVTEVVATLATRVSHGFTRPVPSVVAVAGVLGAYVLFAQALKRGLPVAVAYSIWAAAGVLFVALIGAAFLDDGLTWVQGVGVALIVGGVIALELGGTDVPVH